MQRRLTAVVEVTGDGEDGSGGVGGGRGGVSGGPSAQANPWEGAAHRGESDGGGGARLWRRNSARRDDGVAMALANFESSVYSITNRKEKDFVWNRTSGV